MMALLFGVFISAGLIGIIVGCVIVLIIVPRYIKNENSLVGVTRRSQDLEEEETEIYALAINFRTGMKFRPPSSWNEARKKFIRASDWERKNEIVIKGRPMRRASIVTDGDQINFLKYPDGKIFFDAEDEEENNRMMIVGSADPKMGSAIEGAVDQIPAENDKNKALRQRVQSYIRIVRQKSNDIIKSLAMEQAYNHHLEINQEILVEQGIRQRFAIRHKKRQEKLQETPKKDILLGMGFEEEDITKYLEGKSAKDVKEFEEQQKQEALKELEKLRKEDEAKQRKETE